MSISHRIAWASAFFFAVASFYAPLAYGCTRPEFLPTLYQLLGLGIAAGIASWVTARRWPAVPALVLLGATAVLVQGWWMTYNPVFADLVAANGGLVDSTAENVGRLSFNEMLMTTMLLGSFVVLCDLLANQTRRRFLLLAATGSGVLICLIGDFLKTFGQSYMQYVWTGYDAYWNDFALYKYQGNAGAFLNLIWPLILVFTRRAYTPRGGHIKKLIWTIFCLACAAALFLNASRAALIIGLLILPWPFLSRLLRLQRKNLVILCVIVLGLIGVGLFVSTRVVEQSSFARLTNPSDVSLSLGGRFSAYHDYVDALPDVGAFGFGPGLFQLAFPYQNSPLGMRNIGLREYAHQDYLQTVLEWGWVGTFFWTLLVAGGLYRGFRTYGQRELFASKTERHLVLAAILGVLATLAQAAVDFPLQIASLRLFFLLLLALCWASPHMLTPREAPVRTRFRLVIPSDSPVEAEAGVE